MRAAGADQPLIDETKRDVFCKAGMRVGSIELLGQALLC